MTEQKEITQILNDEGFKFLTGDINFIEYGGTWYKTDDNETYTIIELINMEYATDGCPFKYLLCLDSVYLENDLEDKDLVFALESSGYNNPAYYHTIPDLTKVECLHGAGYHDHIYDISGNNLKPMIEHIIKADYHHPYIKEYKEDE